MDSFNDWIEEEKRKRMVLGEKKHGPLDLSTDPRDFIQEAIEELIDALNYLEFSMFRGEIGFCRWFLIDRDIRFTITRMERKQTSELRLN